MHEPLAGCITAWGVGTENGGGGLEGERFPSELCRSGQGHQGCCSLEVWGVPGACLAKRPPRKLEGILDLTKLLCDRLLLPRRGGARTGHER